MNPAALCLVALGGAMGATLRYVVSLFISPSQAGIPWATLLVNVVGSLLIGLVMAFFSDNTPSHKQVQLLMAKGFCGGFTTFSSFSLESLQLLQAGQSLIALGYMFFSCVLCVLGVGIGFLLGRSLKLGSLW